MFDKLKKAFSSAARSISQKELSSKDLDESLFDLNISLLESDVSQEVIDDLSAQIKTNLVGMKLQKNESTEEIIVDTLRRNFSAILDKAGTIDLLKAIQDKKQSKSGPFKIVFLGINGTGKTTTVAKVANMLRKSGFSVVIAAADTHRAGAIEQISAHAEKLSIKVISQRYGADPSAVSRDALEYARKHYVDVVLIDTAGRMQTAKNLMDEIGKIVKVIKPDLKLFVGDSLSGNDTINQAKEFFSYTSFDGAILTKADADAKGGSVISISYITSKPIIYLGIGQGYDDILLFDKEKFVETIFSNTSLIESQRQSQFSKFSEKSNDLIVSAALPIEKRVDNSELKIVSDIRSNTSSSVINPKITDLDPAESSLSVDTSSNDHSSYETKNSDTKDSSSNVQEPKEPSVDYSLDSSKSMLIERSANNELDGHDVAKDKSSEKKSRFGWFKRKK
ncbi:signal recognition particle-docking protein FtsY [Candidatus Nitrosocosmicus agrestis]|jgi:fused signal recognition particle receptor|uniref:signal recognition particle-docking protein FtsY n=1 Tax=Candidatus Nitrosocosmicus agrestis TaxID=2563600 RepID=UPI00122E8FF7|nr:signal recognition particle-docking protein FtsY [Candidatus Nitrosocosmicus sp. SS]KAA2280790.1 signal recognition particle-docking protein FtsY [Candidatus Nitrosocosmicus sp. SS]KAF0868875.1 signal recognition particle-docking protein FtsY [Candidatus Nitrosocosmicus sp. SS]